MQNKENEYVKRTQKDYTLAFNLNYAIEFKFRI